MSDLSKLFQFYALVMEMTACIVGGLLIGYFIDGYFHTSPWFMLVFFILGMIAGIKILFIIINRAKIEG